MTSGKKVTDFTVNNDIYIDTNTVWLISFFGVTVLITLCHNQALHETFCSL